MRLLENFYQIGKDIQADVDKYKDKLGRGAYETIKKSQAGLKASLREMVRGAGLGNRLANTWQDSDKSGKKLIYPKGKFSLNATGLVISLAPDVIASFDKGLTIRGVGGGLMAIPTEHVPRAPRGSRYTPDNWPKERFGPLRLVKKRNGEMMLVTDQADLKRYGTAKINGKRVRTNVLVSAKKRAAYTVMFHLVPQVKHRKRFDVGAIARNWLLTMRGLLTAELNKKG